MVFTLHTIGNQFRYPN